MTAEEMFERLGWSKHHSDLSEIMYTREENNLGIIITDYIEFDLNNKWIDTHTLEDKDFPRNVPLIFTDPRVIGAIQKQIEELEW